MEVVYYMSKSGQMAGIIKENHDGTWSMYRGFINGILNYCGDFESVHHAIYRMEKDGWEEIKK